MQQRWIIVTLLCLILFFFQLGSLPLMDPDEPVYAQTAKEMLAAGDWLSPRIFGEVWFDKPPMYYWLVAGVTMLLGPTEWAARLPAAAMALGTVWLVYAFMKNRFGSASAAASAVVLATSLEFFYLAKGAVTDSTLTFFLTACLLAYWEKRIMLAYVLAALATLTKGPVGLLFPGAILLLELLSRGDWRGFIKLQLPKGLLVYAAVALPWYIAMYAVHGQVFVDTFLGMHNVTRFTSAEHDVSNAWTYFVPVLILGFFPWVTLLPQTVWLAWKEAQYERRTLRFLLLWAAFIFIFFTIAKTKLVSYILPMFPPLAMLVGWRLSRLWVQPAKQRAWAIACGALHGLLGAGLIYGQTLMPALAWGAFLAAGILLVTGAGASWQIWRGGYQRAWVTLAAGASAFLLTLVLVLLPLAAPQFTAKEIAEDFKANYDGASSVYVIKFLRPGFVYYTDASTEEVGTTLFHNKVDTRAVLQQMVSRQERAYFVLRLSDYRLLSEAEQKKLTVLSTRYEVLLLLKEGTL